MLKKAGIVVAAAAAGLLALSPLAFAGDKGDDHGHHHGSSSVDVDENSNNATGDENIGLVNVTGNNVNVPIQACNNDVPVNVLGVQVSDVQADLTGALGLLGTAEAEDEGGAGDTRTCDQDAAAGDALVQNIDD
ncbi:hypothetical protein [Pseudonocardia sp.]|uniref:hypothetical protein n=1 Tax=Pseudonocardia sp. TaxID=60912 RepID=UPI002628EB44|nr:hypothetical protein [Pseudonocardia sp.]